MSKETSGNTAPGYYVAYESTIPRLRDEVNRNIAEGFRPVGGIAVRSTIENGEYLYMQAMIKETP